VAGAVDASVAPEGDQDIAFAAGEATTVAMWKFGAMPWDGKPYSVE
jgi:hypothetical protein